MGWLVHKYHQRAAYSKFEYSHQVLLIYIVGN